MEGQTTELSSFDDILKQAKTTYKVKFGSYPDIACCAPGRVNLIGEHVDYNDGFVLPMVSNSLSLSFVVFWLYNLHILIIHITIN